MEGNLQWRRMTLQFLTTFTFTLPLQFSLKFCIYSGENVMNRIQTKTRLSKILYFYEINVLVTVYFSEIQNVSFRLCNNFAIIRFYFEFWTIYKCLWILYKNYWILQNNHSLVYSVIIRKWTLHAVDCNIRQLQKRITDILLPASFCARWRKIIFHFRYIQNCNVHFFLNKISYKINFLVDKVVWVWMTVI